MTKPLWAGIDLHSNNLVIGIINQRVKHQKLVCDLQRVDEFLSPYKPQLKSIAVESTYNWYWLVDGLRARAYPVQLANPAQMQPYSGIKHAEDTNDAYFLAELQRWTFCPPATFTIQHSPAAFVPVRVPWWKKAGRANPGCESH